MKNIYSLTLGVLITATPLITVVACSNTITNSNKQYMYSKGSEVLWRPNHKIIDVHDGDTFKDESNTSWRLLSVDTPEVSHIKNGVWIKSIGIELYWAMKATNFVSRHILNKEVMIASKNAKTYDRVVGALFYREVDGTIKNLALELVRLGLARIGYIAREDQGNPKYRVPNFYYNLLHKLSNKAKRDKQGYFQESLRTQKCIYPKQGISS